MAKLFIICGHGAGDPGACGNGYEEQERVRTLAKYIKKHGGDNVIIGDSSKNWYRSNLVSTYNFPAGCQILELHMDSASASARGGHVIIATNAGGADQYDKALAQFISKTFPGRPNSIVQRGDLANPNRANARRLSYRLLECCFISNLADMKTFNGSLDYIAKGILNAFGISTSTSANQTKPTSVGVHIQSTNGGNAQKWIVEKEADGRCRLKSKSTGLYLDVKDGNSAHGNPVRAYVGNDTDAQLWRLDFQDKTNDKWFYLRSALNDERVLACYKGGKTAGTGIVIGTYDQANAQKWAFVWAGEAGVYYIINLGSGMALAADK